MRHTLSELKRHLEALSSPLHIKRDDQELPEGLQELAGSIPLDEIVLAEPVITFDGSALSIAGCYPVRWEIAAISGAWVDMKTLTITVVCEKEECTVSARANGSAFFSEDLQFEAWADYKERNGYWTIIPCSENQFTSAMMMQLAGGYPMPVLAQTEFMDKRVGVSQESLEIRVIFGEAAQYLICVSVDLPAEWEIIPNVLKLECLHLTWSYGQKPQILMISGQMVVGSLPVEAGVVLRREDSVPFWIAPANDGSSFPGIAAMANWIGAKFEDGSLKETLGWDSSIFDAAICEIRGSLNLKTNALEYISISSVMRFFGLEFVATVSLPDLSLRAELQGSGPDDADVFIQQAAPSVPGLPDHFSIISMSLTACFQKSRYDISIFLGGSLTLEPLTLHCLYAVLSYDRAFHLTFGGQLAIGPADIQMEAAYQDGAWRFQGSMQSGGLLDVKTLLRVFSEQFHIVLPETLASFCLSSLSVCYDMGTGAFLFSCEGEMTIDQTPVDMVVKVNAVREASGYHASVSGEMKLLGMDFLLKFVHASNQDLLLAVYQQEDGRIVSLREIIGAISPAAALAVPPGLNIGMQEAALGYLREECGGRFLFQTALSMECDLASLPVVGSVPGVHDSRIGSLFIGGAGGYFSAADMLLLQRNLPEGYRSMPETALNGGLFFTANLSLGGEEQVLVLDSGEAQQEQENAASGYEEGSRLERMFDVYKRLGPIELQRIGIAFQEPALMLRFDGGAAFGPFRMTWEGLSFGSALDHFAPAAGIDGLALSCSLPSVQVAGSIRFVSSKGDQVKWYLGGNLAVTTAGWSFSAMASYVEPVDGPPSLFVFFQVKTTIGSNPAFVLERLMGGFGIHRNLVPPAIEEVENFPFLQLDETPDTALQMMEGRAPGRTGVTKQWLQVREGDYWLAAGIHFSSYGILKGRLLLSAVFGNQFLLMLTGLGTVKLPEGDSPYVNLQVAMLAYFCPDDGVLSVEAKLTSESYVLHRDCRLTGGLALRFWFGMHPMAGRFVITAGGYHPSFAPPAEYPKADRLAINWKVSEALQMKGEAYFALTPDCAMAGAALEIQFHSGPLRAWFLARANFLVAWHPFSFRGDIAVEVGVSLRLSVFGFKSTISLSLGASLDLWGPPVGGEVKLHILFLTVTISFGETGARDERYRKLEFHEFQALLPEPDQILSLGVSNGLLDEMEIEGETCWLIKPGDFSFTVQSALPISESHLQAEGSTRSLSIRPMDREHIRSPLDVRLECDGGRTADLSGSFTIHEILCPYPPALWGAPLRENGRFVQNPSKPAVENAEPYCAGFKLTSTADTGSGVLLPELELQREKALDIFKDALPGRAFSSETGNLETLKHICSGTVAARRSHLLGELNQGFPELASGDMKKFGTHCTLNGIPRIRRSGNEVS